MCFEIELDVAETPLFFFFHPERALPGSCVELVKKKTRLAPINPVSHYVERYQHSTLRVQAGRRDRPWVLMLSFSVLVTCFNLAGLFLFFHQVTAIANPSAITTNRGADMLPASKILSQTVNCLISTFMANI